MSNPLSYLRNIMNGQKTFNESNYRADSNYKPVGERQLAYFAAGCYWGVEHAFVTKYPYEGVLGTKVGFMGGHVDNPDYRQVCTTDTGHAEVIKVDFDSGKTSFRDLVKFFYAIHDPTQLNGQGVDIGDQYRSAIFCQSDEQLTIAKEVTEELAPKFKENIVTDIVPPKDYPFTEASGRDGNHQLYLLRYGLGESHCAAHYVRSWYKSETK